MTISHHEGNGPTTTSNEQPKNSHAREVSTMTRRKSGIRHSTIPLLLAAPTNSFDSCTVNSVENHGGRTHPPTISKLSKQRGELATEFVVVGKPSCDSTTLSTKPSLDSEVNIPALCSMSVCSGSFDVGSEVINSALQQQVDSKVEKAGKKKKQKAISPSATQTGLSKDSHMFELRLQEAIRSRNRRDLVDCDLESLSNLSATSIIQEISNTRKSRKKLQTIRTKHTNDHDDDLEARMRNSSRQSHSKRSRSKSPFRAASNALGLTKKRPQVGTIRHGNNSGNKTQILAESTETSNPHSPRSSKRERRRRRRLHRQEEDEEEKGEQQHTEVVDLSTTDHMSIDNDDGTVTTLSSHTTWSTLESVRGPQFSLSSSHHGSGSFKSFDSPTSHKALIGSKIRKRLQLNGIDEITGKSKTEEDGEEVGFEVSINCGGSTTISPVSGEKSPRKTLSSLKLNKNSPLRNMISTSSRSTQSSKVCSQELKNPGVAGDNYLIESSIIKRQPAFPRRQPHSEFRSRTPDALRGRLTADEILSVLSSERHYDLSHVIRSVAESINYHEEVHNRNGEISSMVKREKRSSFVDFEDGLHGVDVGAVGRVYGVDVPDYLNCVERACDVFRRTLGVSDNAYHEMKAAIPSAV